MNSDPVFDLTSRQKRAVRESFQSIREYSDSVVLLFYGRLFELAPQAKGMFRVEMRDQARKLMDMLNAIVEALEGGEKLRSKLEDLGRRHVAYGVRPEHYDTLMTALLWAFGSALDYEFDSETRTAWEILLRGVSRVMTDGSSVRV